MGAEDGLRQKTDLAAGNKSSVAVAEMRSAIFLYFGGDPLPKTLCSRIVAARSYLFCLLGGIIPC